MKIYKTIILILLSFQQLFTHAQFDFSADTVRACITLDVDFSLNTTTGITNIEWDFGNGMTSNSLNPLNITFNNEGSYTVVAIINNTDTIIKEDYINIYNLPLSDFVFTSDSTPGNFSFLFISESQDYSDLTYTYIWDFGDGSDILQADSTIVFHRFNDVGSYITSLTVENEIGCSSDNIETVEHY